MTAQAQRRPTDLILWLVARPTARIASNLYRHDAGSPVARQVSRVDQPASREQLIAMM